MLPLSRSVRRCGFGQTLAEGRRVTSPHTPVPTMWRTRTESMEPPRPVPKLSVPKLGAKGANCLLGLAPGALISRSDVRNTMTNGYRSELDCAIRAATAAGMLLRRAFHDGESDADGRAEREIHGLLMAAFPQYGCH